MRVDNEISDSDNEVDDATHSNLVAAVTQLEGKQRVKSSVRKEPSIEVSEFHLVKSGTGQKDAVEIHELTQVLGKQASHNAISLKIHSSKRQSKTLPKPLEKPEADRIDRTVRYDNVKKQLGRWNAIVQTNRLSDHLTFPLNTPNLGLEQSKEFLKKLTPQTPLEVEMAKVLNDRVIVEDEDENDEPEFPLSLQEMVLRRKELAKLRVQQSYREAKAHRQSKIKSKKYHRILRKEKVKQSLKDFEVLKNTNPEAALKQLEELDKTRVEERASLRHRSTGKWAKSKAVRAKYDIESRKVLAQQLTISRDLTQKVRKEDSSDEDDNETLDTSTNQSDNPWVGPVKTGVEITNFLSGYRKYWDEKNKAHAQNGGNEVEKDEGIWLEESEKEAEEEMNRLSKESVLSESNVEANSNLEIDKIPSKVSASKKVKQSQDESITIIQSNSIPFENEDVAISTIKRKQKRRLSHTEELSGKSKKQKQPPVVGVKIAATSGKWVVTSADEESMEDSKGKRRNSMKEKTLGSANADMDDLFGDIDKRFRKKLNKQIKKLKSEMDIKGGNFTVEDVSDTDDLGASLAFKKTVNRPIVDEELSEGPGRLPLGDANIKTKDLSNQAENMRIGRDIDPNKFMTIKPKHLKTQLPDVITAGEEAIDDEEERQMTITEAFAEDDVVAQFRKEKLDTIARSEPETVSLTMPGWGSWDTNYTVKKEMRKKRRFIKPMPRTDVDFWKGDVIIKADMDKKLREHLVNALPFPFTSVKSFEASIRAPIGNTWIPETSYRKLIAPSVRTKLGAIIQPMGEEVLLNKKDMAMK